MCVGCAMDAGGRDHAIEAYPGAHGSDKGRKAAGRTACGCYDQEPLYRQPPDVLDGVRHPARWVPRRVPDAHQSRHSRLTSIAKARPGKKRGMVSPARTTARSLASRDWLFLHSHLTLFFPMVQAR